MSVSKRVRYEVLRRDQNACQYCGGVAPDVALTIDHVVPVALGGSDDPSNLVAACRDCNAGKTSTPADGPLIAKVSLAAAEFKLALRDRLAELGDEIANELDAVDHFEAMWKQYVPQWKRDAWRLPDDYADTVMRWHRMGVNNDTFEYAIRIAMSKKDVVGSGKFLYTAGIIWTTIRKAEQQIPEPPQDDDYSPEYLNGWDDCRKNEQLRNAQRDYLAALVDSRSTHSFQRSAKHGAIKSPATLADVLAGKMGHYARETVA